MATPATIKQLEERQVDREITNLLWSPKMDILAVVSENNDISLFRLNWQRVRHFPRLSCSILFKLIYIDLDN